MTKNQQIEKRAVKLIQSYYDTPYFSAKGILQSNKGHKWISLARKMIRLEKKVKALNGTIKELIQPLDMDGRMQEVSSELNAENKISRETVKANAVRIWNSKPYDE